MSSHTPHHLTICNYLQLSSINSSITTYQDLITVISFISTYIGVKSLQVSRAMALQWSNLVDAKAKPKKPRPVIPPPEFSKRDLVFIVGMTNNSSDSSFDVCEIIDFGYRLHQREYVYFCKTVDQFSSEETIILCTKKHLRKPKYCAGTRLHVRDLDDRVNGVGITSDWKVSIECLEFVNGKFMYWIKVPGAGNKKGSLLLDVEENKLEKMASAAAARRKKKMG